MLTGGKEEPTAITIVSLNRGEQCSKASCADGRRRTWNGARGCLRFHFVRSPPDLFLRPRSNTRNTPAPHGRNANSLLALLRPAFDPCRDGYAQVADGAFPIRRDQWLRNEFSDEMLRADLRFLRRTTAQLRPLQSRRDACGLYPHRSGSQSLRRRLLLPPFARYDVATAVWDRLR